MTIANKWNWKRRLHSGNRVDWEWRNHFPVNSRVSGASWGEEIRGDELVLDVRESNFVASLNGVRVSHIGAAHCLYWTMKDDWMLLRCVSVPVLFPWDRGFRHKWSVFNRYALMMRNTPNAFVMVFTRPLCSTLPLPAFFSPALIVSSIERGAYNI